MRVLLAVFAASLAVAGCGTTPAERGVSGGALGAGAGAAIGSLSGNAGAGAVIGGVSGAAAGLLTTPPPASSYGYYDQNGFYRGPRCVQWSSVTAQCIAWRN
jgi:osmotically inducible lipoprotein OsmB